MENTEKNTRILIKQDNEKLAEIISDLGHFRPYLDKVQQSFEDLNIGSFDNDTFKKVVENPTSFKAIYNTELNKQLDESNITFPKLRENMLVGTELAFETFIDSVKELKSYHPPRSSHRDTPPLKLDQITFDENKFLCSEDDKEKILEDNCRIYLNTKEEIALYQALQVFEAAFNSVYSHCKSFGFVHNGIGLEASPFNTVKHFFNADESGEINLTPENFESVKGFVKRAIELGGK